MGIPPAAFVLKEAANENRVYEHRPGNIQQH